MENGLQYTEGNFEPRSGVRLHQRWWEPVEPFKAVVVIAHGLAEHSGRYAHVAKTLCRHGYLVGAYDQFGHGRSDGKRAFISSFDDFLDDLDVFLRYAAEKAGDRKVFLLGHSMGSGVVIKYLLDRRAQGVRGAVLSGSMIMAGDSVPPLLEKVVSMLGALAPHLPVLQLDSSTVSRDPQVVKRYENDPLNFRGKLTARTGAELNRTFRYIQQNLGRIELPLLIMQGSEDRLVNPAGSRMLYEQAASKDKTFKIYEGLYHEILNEPEQEQVMADMVAWMDARL